jgi:hypothetical protein
MADISDVYGDTYADDSAQLRVGHLLSIIVNNVSHRQFTFKMSDAFSMWNGSQDLPASTIMTLITRIQNANDKLKVFHLDKRSPQINMLPELVIDTPVEYFMIVDAEMNRSYFIYLTPNEVHAY